MDKRNIVVMEQPETKIYVGDTGYIVVKQVDWQDIEQTILIDPLHAKTIANAIMGLQKDAQNSFEEWKVEDE